MNFIIRQEENSDYKLTERVIENAFAFETQSNQDEHKLVSRLRASDAFIPELSLVAVNEETKEILGHILLSKASIVNNGELIAETLALAPVSVLPSYQNKGIGHALIEASLKKAADLEFDSVVVLGHSEYYPRFGFKKSSLWQIKAPFEVPEEALMAIELQEKSLKNISGVIEYSTAFFE